MRITKTTLMVIMVGVTLSSCVTDGRDDVYSAIEGRVENDGKSLTLRGLLKTNSGFYNLFSSDRKECIGLLLTDSQRQSYEALVDQKVVVTGNLDAEGCGRDGICVEHICGPTILTDVSVSPAS